MATETQTWYRVSTYFNVGKIEAYVVVGETAKFITYTCHGIERREGKNTEYYTWLPAEGEAVVFARTLLTASRDRYRIQLENAEHALAAFNAEHPET